MQPLVPVPPLKQMDLEHLVWNHLTPPSGVCSQASGGQTHERQVETEEGVIHRGVEVQVVVFVLPVAGQRRHIWKQV